MNLSDKEVLDLNQLCNALIDATITEAQTRRLSQYLAASAEARRFYVRAMGLSASLVSYAGELQTEAPEEPRVPAEPSNVISLVRWLAGSLAAAASIALVVWFSWPRPATALP